LRALNGTVRAARGVGAWIGIYDEMASDPELTEVLVGLGFGELSMSAVTIPEVEARVAETDGSQARRLVR